jgi:hypothetical protein
MAKPSIPVDLQNSPDNFLQFIYDMDSRIVELETAESPQIEEITGGRVSIFDLGLSPAEGILVADPTSTEYTGVFIAGDGILYGSDTYVFGSVENGVIKAGFKDDGTLFAEDAVIEGTIIIGTGSEAGGWFINSTSIFNDGISLDSSIPAILIGDATAVNVGSGVFIGNDAGTYKMRIGDPGGNYLLWDGNNLSASGQWIRSAGMNPALQQFETNIVFSSASDTQVNWTSGTIRLSDGTTYSISSGNTGAMAALTYIYLDIAISTTVLQTTTTYTTAVGDGKILVATAQNATAGASVLPVAGQQPIINGGAQITALSILAGNIAAGAITASKISVTSLSAITATMGSLTIDDKLTMSGASGAIAIGTTPPTSSVAGTGLWIDRTGVYSLDTNVRQATLSSAGLTAGAGAVTLNADGMVVIGEEFSSVSPAIVWVADSVSGAEIGNVVSFYNDASSPKQSGVFLFGRAKDDTDYYGVVSLGAQSAASAVGTMLSQFRVDTRGIAQLLLDDGTNTASSSKALFISTGYATTNAPQTGLYIDVHTTGTAAAGIGSALALRAENASGTVKEAAIYFGQFSDVTNAAEYSKAGFYTMVRSAIVARWFSGVVHSSNARTTISTAGSTTVFSITVPAYYFVAGFLRFSCAAWLDQNANNRTLTATLTVGATSAVAALGGAGANANTLWNIYGTVGRGGANVQDLFLWMDHTIDNSSSPQTNGEYEQAGSTESGTITVSLTLSLNGSVDAGWFNNVVVEAIDNGSTW